MTARCGRVFGSRTQDNTQEDIHEEEDEMRATKDKTNEKGKRKLEKHDALCEAEHKSTTNKSANATGRPTSCGQAPGKLRGFVEPK